MVHHLNSCRENIGTAAAAAVGEALNDSERDGQCSSRRAPRGTNNSSEGGRGSGHVHRSLQTALGSTSAGESLPRPFPKSEHLERGLETEAPPSYERIFANIPGERAGSRTPVSSSPLPAETGKLHINAPTHRTANPGAFLTEDDEFDGDLMLRDETLTKDVTAGKGDTTLVHAGGQGADVATTRGATPHGDDAGLSQVPVNSLPSNGRRKHRSSGGGVDVVQAVVEAAHCLASHSAIPGVCEAARLISVLVELVTDYQDGTSEMEWRVKRCRSIIFMLERAGEVLGKVRRPPNARPTLLKARVCSPRKFGWASAGS